MKRHAIFCFVFLLMTQAHSQLLDLEAPPEDKKETNVFDSSFYASVVDENYGITIYDNLNYHLGGDSIRHDKKGYAARGWIEDYYPNGQILHRGYYLEGQLKIYKNFYPSGQLERNYRTLDNYRSTLETFYSDGTMKSKISYNEGYPLTWEDYYPSGKLEYKEEFHKSLDYYIIKKSYYPNGQLESSLQLMNKTKKIYDSEEYTDKGILKEKGQIIFNIKVFDYQKIGKWIVYDASGKEIKHETYVDGKLTKEKNL